MTSYTVQARGKSTPILAESATVEWSGGLGLWRQGRLIAYWRPDTWDRCDPQPSRHTTDRFS